ncbi:MAG: hypothetical protein JWQ42_3679 [Edaphobacter sp.]|nr:hypothetical protein [Edaphobacter sp.]
MSQRAHKFCVLAIVTASCLLPCKGTAQNLSNTTSLSAELPDAPGIGSGFQSSEQGSDASQSHASISGTVTDRSGSVIPNAHVTLTGTDAAGKRVAISDVSGRFTFSNLPPGAYRLSINAEGFQTFEAGEVVLAAGEMRELPATALPIVAARTDVTVTANSEQVAQAQVQLEEKQRVLGIIPNFYSSYIWDAAPLTPRLKFHLALRSATDPVAFLLAGGVAGIEQAHNTFPGYDAGPEGYAKRYGAAYADHVIGGMVGHAILPSLFHQDPRYFYKGKGTIRSRALYAIGATVITRGDNGRSQPNFSNLFGNFAAAGISNLYRSPEDRSASLTLRNGLVITGSDAIGNLIREFLLRNLTSKVPSFAQGKPDPDR